MNKPFRAYLTIFILIAIVSGLYWLLPINGKLAYIPDSLPQTNTWPQISIINKTDNELEVIVQDVTPWVFVRLELAGTETTLTECFWYFKKAPPDKKTAVQNVTTQPSVIIRKT